MTGYIKFKRNYDKTIHDFPLAFNLLAVISQRAKWRESINNKNLKFGEALIGDYKNYGMTRQQYRTSLMLLKSTNYITTKSTNRGTIVKLVKSTIFDINFEESNQQNDQQSNQKATNKQPLTKKYKESLASLTTKDSFTNEDFWNKNASSVLEEKNISDPFVIEKARQSFISKAKSPTLHSLEVFITKQAEWTPPDEYIDFSKDFPKVGKI